MASWHALTEWLRNHPLLYPFILFLLGGFLTLYSGDIKRFLHEWPRTKEKARQAGRNKAIFQLELLTSLHNDSYQLLLYFAERVTQVVYWGVFCAPIAIIIGIFSSKVHPLSLLFGMWAGNVIAESQRVRKVLAQLHSYDKSVAMLQQQAEPPKE